MIKKTQVHRILIGMFAGMAFASLTFLFRSAFIYAVPASFYYSFEQPISVPDKDLTCEPDPQKVIIFGETVRTSRINMTVIQERDLVRVTDNGISRLPGQYISSEFVIRNVTEVVQVPFSVSCDKLETGTYLIEGATNFEIDGVKKRYSWQTEPFNITVN